MGKFANHPKARPSKRKPLSQGYKIEKRVREHNRKVRKQGQQMKSLGIFKKKITEELEIPNSYPFKSELIDNFKHQQKQAEREKKLKRQKEKEKRKNENGGGDNEEDDQETKTNNTNQQKNLEESYEKTAQHYQNEMRRVIEESDFIIEVLDARDPLTTRSKALESQILSMKPEKQIIIVLNKIDLIPQGNAEAWLKYFRREHPTVLYKANSQDQSVQIDEEEEEGKKSTQEQTPDEYLQSTKAVGAESLLQLIKSFSRVKGALTSVCVGVIGYPNVGKSTLVNSLKKTQVCGVSHNPFFTKSMQMVQIDKNLQMFDSPGVIFNKETDKSYVLFRNFSKSEDLEDPSGPIGYIISKVPKNNLLLNYKIPDFQNANEFLSQISLSKGQTIKGGEPDIIFAGRLVLQDWNMGKIRYYSIPPQE